MGDRFQTCLVHLNNTSANAATSQLEFHCLPITFDMQTKGIQTGLRPSECRPRYQLIKKCNKTNLRKNPSATCSLFLLKNDLRNNKISKNPTYPKMPQTPHGNYKNPGLLKNPHQGFAATSVPWRLSFFQAAMISKRSISGLSKKKRENYTEI